MNTIRQIKAYACVNQNLEERMSSSSGGIFSLLAKSILSRKGSVYGVTMTENLKTAEYIRIIDKSKLYKLNGSKYLQAHVGKIFLEVKKDLEEGRFVLFSGTACHINGLISFLGKKFVNLYCVDVVCHGTPSPALWKQYVNYIVDQNGGNLVDINFRCKDKKWAKFEKKENKRYLFSSMDKDPYMIMFLRDYCLRPSCYTCIAKTKKHSDISLADFWGVDKIISNMNDEKGTSLVMIRSEKGINLFNEIKNQIKLQEVSYSESIKYNIAEFSSVKKPIEREYFFKDMNTLSFDMLKERYGKPNPITIKKTLKMIKMKVLNKDTINWSNFGLLFVLNYEKVADESKSK